MRKVIVHIDMDMFYAAVEMRDQPKLQEKPMAVGTVQMLSTSNYKVLKASYINQFYHRLNSILLTIGAQVWSTVCNARLHRQEALSSSRASSPKHGQVRCGGAAREENSSGV